MRGSSDSREMLDRAIFEYLLKKKMRYTAEIFALETRIPTTPIVAENIPDGLLLEWWRFNYDIHSDRLRNYSNSEGASSSRNPGNETQCRSSMQMPTPLHQPQTLRPFMMPPPQLLSNLSQDTSQFAGLSYSQQTVVPTVMPSLDRWNFLQNGPSPMPTPGLVNPQPTASPTMMPSPGFPILPSMMLTPGIPNSQQMSSRTMMPKSEMANLQLSVPSTIMPTPDQLNQDRFGTIPSPNFNMMLGQTMTNWIAARMHEQESLVLPVTRLFDVNLLVNIRTSLKTPRFVADDEELTFEELLDYEKIASEAKFMEDLISKKAD